MGWLYSTQWSTRKELKSHILNEVRQSVGDRLLDHGGSGSELYVLIKSNTGENVILCFIMRGGGKDHGWGYKDMDEAMGPNYYNCPERLLAKSTCQAEYAVNWREACRELRRNKSTAKNRLKSVPVGSLVFRTRIKQRSIHGTVVECLPARFDGFYKKRQITHEPASQYVFRYDDPNLPRTMYRDTIGDHLVIPENKFDNRCCY